MINTDYNKSEVRRLYTTYLAEVLMPTTSPDRQKEILKGFTHKRLNAMLMTIYGFVPSGDNLHKVNDLRDYFDAEVRTADLCKNLY